MSEDKVTKQRNPKRQAAGCKGHEKYMEKLKEDILKNVGSNGDSDATSSTTSSGSGSTNGGINTTNDNTIATSTTTNGGSGITNFSYIHGAGAIAVLSLGFCIFIIPKYLKKTAAQPENKGPEKISKIRRKML